MKPINIQVQWGSASDDLPRIFLDNNQVGVTQAIVALAEAVNELIDLNTNATPPKVSDGKGRSALRARKQQ